MTIFKEILEKTDKAINSENKEEILRTYKWVDSYFVQYENITSEEAWIIREAAQIAMAKLAHANIKLDIAMQS